MKLSKILIVPSILGYMLASSTAYSGDGMSGTTGATEEKDGMTYQCLPCQRLPMPAMMCPAILCFKSLCGTETWTDGTNRACVTIYYVNLVCGTGEILRYTVDEWAGAGTYCDGQLTGCHT